jgi:hypothetical protein
LKKTLGDHLFRILLLTALLTPALAAAQPVPQSDMMGDPTYQRHFGFFFRPEFGFGYVSSSASAGGIDYATKGGGASLALAIGGAVSENFIIGAQAWDIVAISPTVELGGMSASTSSDTSSGVVGYGLLLNWYLPGNTYLALTPSLTRLTLSDNGKDFVSEWGFGLRAVFGKEWWVSNHWGLGLAGGLGFSSNKDSAEAGAPTWKTFGFSVNLSATYN